MIEFRPSSAHSHDVETVATLNNPHSRVRAPEQIVVQRFVPLRRVVLTAASSLVAVNIWTGCPLLALWIGSISTGQRYLSMTAMFIVVIVLAAEVFAMAAALTWLSTSYDELIGRPPPERRATWLRSMRAEEERHIKARRGITDVERVVMVSVYASAVSLTVWFLFFAGVPLLAG